MQMKNRNITSLKLVITLLFFIVLWLIQKTIAIEQKMLLFLVISILAIILILKNKNITKNDIFVGVLLGVMAMPYSIVNGLVTIIAYIGGVSVFKNSNNKITLIKSNERKQIVKTIMLAAFVGIVLGVINSYLGKFFNEINPSFKVKWLLMAVYAGVGEEVVFRFFFFAICIWLTKDKELSRFENFLCYLIIIVPHALNHFDRMNINLSGVIQLSIMFGLPFALMQRKQDLSSAIGAHAIVDLIRFCIFGV